MASSAKSAASELILASSSPYRRMLLERLTDDFSCYSPAVDESPHNGESAARLAVRLASAKAGKLAAEWPAALVIGSDQTAELGGKILGKPGTAAKAREQLRASSGQTVTFYTGVCLRRETPEFEEVHLDETRVRFRDLSDAEIAAYVQADSPLDCAGSFKAEGLGSVLFEAIENNDPSAIIGLPLIWLANALRRAGYLLV